MAEAAHKPANGKLANGLSRIDFATDPARYRHWTLAVDGAVATLTMDVDENGGLFEGYELKLNSYDLGVDIELADAFERIRFEHPAVRVVQLRSGKPRVFCAGANIRMLAGASHAHKVNFCKFTNETRNAIEDASAASGVRTIAVINGTAAGGGYELALAADHIVLVDDGSSAVSLPEVPLLAVLPGTGGLTRVTDKRRVRRDHADVFCTTEEGVKGRRAVAWRLVDTAVPNSQLENAVAATTREWAAGADGMYGTPGGIALTPLAPAIGPDRRDYRYVAVAFDRDARLATIVLRGPAAPPPASVDEMVVAGRGVLAAAACPRTRRCDPRYPPQRDGCCRDRVQVGRRCRRGARPRRLPRCPSRALAGAGNPAQMAPRAQAHRPHLALPGRAGRAGLVLCRHARRDRVRRRSFLHADRHHRRRQPRAGGDHAAAPSISVRFPCATGSPASPPAFSASPRNWRVRGARWECRSMPMRHRPTASSPSPSTTLDWEDEIRVFLEERASFSPDALTGLEANLRFAGPETMETKIFGRLTAWQNWIFQRPNAVGETGALGRYGTGRKPQFDTKRV